MNKERPFDASVRADIGTKRSYGEKVWRYGKRNLVLQQSGRGPPTPRNR